MIAKYQAFKVVIFDRKMERKMNKGPHMEPSIFYSWEMNGTAYKYLIWADPKQDLLKEVESNLTVTDHKQRQQNVLL